MFERWELLYSPSEKDKNRWRLKMKITEESLDSIFVKIEVNTGRPFSTADADYNWGVYLYNITSDERRNIVKSLKEHCHEGRIVVEGMELSVEEELESAAQSAETRPEAAMPEEPAAQMQSPKEQSSNAGQSPKEQSSNAGQSPKTAGQPEAQESEAAQEDFWKLELNARYTFDEFIIGPNNRFTHAAAMAVAENPGKVYNPFFIYGGVGLGKTHLMQSIGHHILEKNPLSKVFYVTSEKFISEVIDSIGRGNSKQFRDRYRQVDVLLIDDVQFLAESESTQEEFFHTFNILHQNNKQLVLTSDRPPKQLTTLEDRLRSRFEWGLIADIKSPTLETRVAILKKKSEGEHVLLDNNMLLYIAGKLKSNIRELEGFIKRINAYANILGRQVDMDLVKELMVELLPEEREEDVRQVPAAPAYTAPSPKEVKAYQPPVTEPAAPARAVQEKAVPAYKPPVQPAAPKPKIETAEVDLKQRAIEVACFYPEGRQDELVKVKEKFKAIIKKHNLKFRIESVFDRSYDPHMKINYNMFPELCKTNKIKIAVVIGPSPDAGIGSEEFINALLPIMENEKISMQFIPWHELDKDYRYLNLALDITLSSHKY